MLTDSQKIASGTLEEDLRIEVEVQDSPSLAVNIFAVGTSPDTWIDDIAHDIWVHVRWLGLDKQKEIDKGRV